MTNNERQSCVTTNNVACDLICREAFEGLDVGNLIQREPLMLTVNIESVFSEVKRLMPKQDPAQYVHRNPTVVLSMDEHMMGSTIDRDLTR